MVTKKMWCQFTLHLLTTRNSVPSKTTLVIISSRSRPKEANDIKSVFIMLLFSDLTFTYTCINVKRGQPNAWLKVAKTFSEEGKRTFIARDIRSPIKSSWMLKWRGCEEKSLPTYEVFSYNICSCEVLHMTGFMKTVLIIGSKSPSCTQFHNS